MRIGVDVGGTKIEAIALDKNGEVLAKKRVLSPKENYSATIETICKLIIEIEEKAEKIQNQNNTATVGIGIPGSISTTTGLVKNANSTWLIGQQLEDDLIKVLKRPIKLENDANCFVLSETIDGAARGYSTVFGVILGTGVGGSFSINSKIWTGINKIAGEWGHNPLPWPSNADDGSENPGNSCYCGQFGCIETFLSGKGLSRSHGILSSKAVNEALDPLSIIQLSGSGEKHAIRALELYAVRLAKSLATVINLLDPEVIVLGGGLSKMEFLYQKIPELWSKWIFSDQIQTLLVKNQHGDSSGVRGAAQLWTSENIG